MRHLKKGRKFGREEGQRAALLKTMAGSLFLCGKIQTTEAKAKELRPYVEKFVTRAARTSHKLFHIRAQFFCLCFRGLDFAAQKKRSCHGLEQSRALSLFPSEFSSFFEMTHILMEV